MKVKNTNKSKKQIKYKKTRTFKQRGSGGTINKSKNNKDGLLTQTPENEPSKPIYFRPISPPKVHKMQKRSTGDNQGTIIPISSLEEKRLRDMSRGPIDSSRTRKMPQFKRFTHVPYQHYDSNRSTPIPIMKANSIEPINSVKHSQSLSDMERGIPTFKKVNSFDKYLNKYVNDEEESPPYFGGKKCKHKNNKTCKRCKKK